MYAYAAREEQLRKAGLTEAQIREQLAEETARPPTPAAPPPPEPSILRFPTPSADEEPRWRLIEARGATVERLPDSPLLRVTGKSPVRIEQERLGQAEARLRELETAHKEAPPGYEHETYAEYEKHYQKKYLPIHQRLSEIQEARRAEQWYGFAGELERAGLTESEVETIWVNLGYIERTSRTEEEAQKRGKAYMVQWGDVITAKREQELRAEAQKAMEKPFSLEVMERAELFPEQYRGLPGPTEDIIAGVAKVGGLIIGTGEELVRLPGSIARLFGVGEPETTTITKPFGEITFPKTRPPVSFLSALPLPYFGVPEYAKWGPYAIPAAMIVLPLEIKAFSAGAKLAGTAFKTVVQAPFKGLATVAPIGVKTQLIAHPTISRILGVAAPRVKTVPGVVVSKFGQYQSTIEPGVFGVPRTEVAMIGGVMKPAPRWLMPSVFERLMPSAVRAKFYALQAVRGAVKPQWTPLAAYEAMPKSFMQVAVRPGVMGLRAFEVGKKQTLFVAGVKRTEPLIMGGRTAMSLEQLIGLKFKPTFVPYLFRTEPLLGPFISPAMGVGAAMATAYKPLALYDTRIKSTVETKLKEVPFVQKTPATGPMMMMASATKAQMEMGTMEAQAQAMAQVQKLMQGQALKSMQVLSTHLMALPPFVWPEPAPRRLREEEKLRERWRHLQRVHEMGNPMKIFFGIKGWPKARAETVQQVKIPFGRGRVPVRRRGRARRRTRRRRKK